MHKMKGGAAVLKPLVKTCLHNLPSKRPTLEDVFKNLKPIKVSIYQLYVYIGCAVTTNS